MTLWGAAILPTAAGTVEAGEAELRVNLAGPSAVGAVIVAAAAVAVASEKFRGGATAKNKN